MKKSLTLIAAILACAAGAASAQSLSVGKSYVGLQVGSVTIQDTETGSKAIPGLYAGYRMGHYAAEAAYSRRNVDGQVGEFIDLSAVPHFKTAYGFDVLGKVGLRYSRISVPAYNLSAGGTSLVFGVGAEYLFSPQVAGRIMIDHSPRTFNSSLNSTSVNAGVQYNF